MTSYGIVWGWMKLNEIGDNEIGVIDTLQDKMKEMTKWNQKAAGSNPFIFRD